jgi:hypothetical protein
MHMGGKPVFSRARALAVSILTLFGVTASIGLAALVAAAPASADTNQCPTGGVGNRQTDNSVGASFTAAGDTATYIFDSFTDEGSNGGIPGLIAYCIYPSPMTAPDSSTVSAVGADGSAWVDPPQFDNFSFQRPDGNPSNIPLNGKTGITMGTATWSGGIPSQTIVLHINDPGFCTGSADGTCFVLPGTPPPPPQNKDLTVSKTATPSFNRAFQWSITKDVDQTKVKVAPGGTATFNYAVSVTHDSGTDSGWQVAGTITVANPNSSDFTGVNVTDSSDGAGTCSVTDANAGVGETIPANSSVDFPYTCTYTANPGSVKDTATASWEPSAENTPDGSATGSANADFSTVQPTNTDDCVSVTDTFGGALGTPCVGDQNPAVFTYSKTFTGGDTGNPPGTCTEHDNTATFTTNSTGATGSASQAVDVCVGEDLMVKKDATPSFTRTYNWAINKSVTPSQIDQLSGAATANYKVAVNQTGVSDSNWEVDGTITVTNPNDWEPVTLTDVTDSIDNGGTCSVTGDTAQTIAKSSSATLTYQCTYSSQPSPLSGTNTATATWDKSAAFTTDDTADGTASFAFGTPTKAVNQTITPEDTFNGGQTVQLCTLDTSSPCKLTGTDQSPFTSQTYSYTRSFTVTPGACVTYPNTADIKETGQTSSASVKVCGPATPGALTMGFWQNKNGQGYITGGASTGGVCNSGTWLRQYAPFQDLSATATCAQVASYVTNIIKAANASGASMNAMLKAQMLATSLDVYFSDPSLGWNKINAPKPIGGESVDLTMICKMINGSGGSATCATPVSYEITSPAFGGASCLTVSQLLSYAASKSNVGGTTWYGQVKAAQGLAKDTFDAINNVLAFAC